MSISLAKEGKRRRAVLLNSSSRVLHVPVSASQGVSHTSRYANSNSNSFSPRSGSKVAERSAVQDPRQTVRVFDKEDNDVTPQPLYQADPGAWQAKGGQFFLDEICTGSVSDRTTATGSFTLPFSRSLLGSSRLSSQSTIESVNEELEDTFSKWDMPTNLQDFWGGTDPKKEKVTSMMLTQIIEVSLTETDSITLLDIPSTFGSVCADGAEAVIVRDQNSAEFCHSRLSIDKYVDRSMQTVNGPAKNKQVQTGIVVTVDTATTTNMWDMYDTFCSPEQDAAISSTGLEKYGYPDIVVDSSRGVEKSMSLGSTASSVSASSSLKEVEACGNYTNPNSDWEHIMRSQQFQQCLQVMERSVHCNNFQPQLAAYRQLPVIEDSVVKLEAMDQREADTSCPSPMLDCLWIFSYELTRGRSVSSMAWNKNTDFLAVGYGEIQSKSQITGLLCCWSLKNPVWPERVIHCDSAVTSVGFSANSQLAVGMYDGNLATYNMHNHDDPSAIRSNNCHNRHLGPVWQLKWTQKDLSLTGEEKMEALFSVGADGRVCKWFVFNNTLDCIDLMKIGKVHATKKKSGEHKTGKTIESDLAVLTPCLCFDFHPRDPGIYLTGTWEGLIHKCSSSNSQQLLKTYKKHNCPVNSIAWSLLSPHFFLSCSSDWTIQLWKQDYSNPVLSFNTTQSTLRDVKWSPRWATVFGAISDGQLEIWDLNLSILDPVIVQPSAPGVKMTSLMFASQTDCVVVGDSNGHVTVYQLKNLSIGKCSQVNTLEDLLHSVASH